jgi:hypothetical protein
MVFKTDQTLSSGSFADDTELLARNYRFQFAMRKLQRHNTSGAADIETLQPRVTQESTWVKISEEFSSLVKECEKYPGITFHRKLLWNAHMNTTGKDNSKNFRAVSLRGYHGDLPPRLSIVSYIWHAIHESLVTVINPGSVHTNLKSQNFKGYKTDGLASFKNIPEQQMLTSYTQISQFLNWKNTSNF